VGIEMSLVLDNAFLVYAFFILDEMLNMRAFVRILFEIFHQCSYNRRIVKNELGFIGVMIIPE
jgi:hypothetical protein